MHHYTPAYKHIKNATNLQLYAQTETEIYNETEMAVISQENSPTRTPPVPTLMAYTT